MRFLVVLTRGTMPVPFLTTLRWRFAILPTDKRYAYGMILLDGGVRCVRRNLEGCAAATESLSKLAVQHYLSCTTRCRKHGSMFRLPLCQAAGMRIRNNVYSYGASYHTLNKADYCQVSGSAFLIRHLFLLVSSCGMVKAKAVRS